MGAAAAYLVQSGGGISNNRHDTDEVKHSMRRRNWGRGGLQLAEAAATPGRLKQVKHCIMYEICQC